MSGDTVEHFRREGDDVIVPPGRYIVGDLCYTETGDDHSGWDAFLESQRPGTCSDVETGVLLGQPAADFSTAHGDGFYEDDEGNGYSVDSGRIGIMAWPEGEAPEGLVLVEFDEEERCSVSGGVICIGSLRIDTDPSFDDEEDEEDDNEPEEPSAASPRP